MSYNVFFYNGIENAAVNSAETLWQCSENLTHFFLLPYVTYKLMNLAFRFRSPQVQEPAPQGIFSGIKRGLWKFIVAPVAKLGSAEVISHTINQWWLKAAFWEGIRPIPIAFMRPVLERLFLSSSNPYDKNNINFSIREFVPGGEGTWLSAAVDPLVKFKNGVSSMVHTPTTAELLAPKAYELGDSFAKTTEAMINTLQDILGSTTKFWPCIKSPTNATTCYHTTKDYLSARGDVIYKASTPLRASFAEWADWGLDNASYCYENFLKAGIQNSAAHLWNAADAAIWSTSTAAEASTNGWLPAHAAYYIQVTLLGALAAYGTYRTLRFGKDVAKETIRAYCVSLATGARGYFTRQNNAQAPAPVVQPDPNLKPLTDEEINTLIARLRLQ